MLASAGVFVCGVWCGVVSMAGVSGGGAADAHAIGLELSEESVRHADRA